MLWKFVPVEFETGDFETRDDVGQKQPKASKYLRTSRAIAQVPQSGAELSKKMLSRAYQSTLAAQSALGDQGQPIGVAQNTRRLASSAVNWLPTKS